MIIWSSQLQGGFASLQLECVFDYFFLGLYLNSLATVLVRMLVNAIMNPSDGVVKSFTGMYVLR